MSGVRLSLPEAARLMGASQQFLREGLKQGKFSWGTAVKMSGRWTYFINAIKFEEETGIKVR